MTAEMSASEFNESLDSIRWTRRAIGAELDVSHTTVNRWGNGTLAVPHSVATWLRALRRCHEKTPTPPRPATK